MFKTWRCFLQPTIRRRVEVVRPAQRVVDRDQLGRFGDYKLDVTDAVLRELAGARWADNRACTGPNLSLIHI